MSEREFKSYTAAKRFRALMRLHGVDVSIYESTQTIGTGFNGQFLAQAQWIYYVRPIDIDFTSAHHRLYFHLLGLIKHAVQ